MAIQIDGDSGVSGVNGSATTPALQGTDSNTGIVFGTDEVQIATGGTTRATVDSSGNVGINQAPTRELSLHSPNNNNALIHFTNDDTGETASDGSLVGIDGNEDLLVSNQEANKNIRIFNNGAERCRIDSSGRLLLGTSSNQGDHLFQVKDGDASLTKLAEASGGNEVQMLRFRVHNSNNTAQSASLAGITATTVSGWGGCLTFHTKAANGSPNETVTERMRLFNDGRISFDGRGVTTSSNSEDVFYYKEGHIYVANGGDAVMFLNRNTNDGNILHFRQNNTDEGTISVSGSTVSYNGAHLSRWSQLAGGAERTEILRGSVLSNLDEMCEWAHAAQDAVLYTEEDELPEGVSVGDVKTPAIDAYTEDNEQLNRMKVSDVEGDPNVAGVFQAWDDDDDTYDNDFYCAMTGDFIIRIAQGTTVARGDLLMSAGDGTAKPQDDDIVRSKTIAKVTSTTVSTTYSDGSYCVPCVLMAC